MKLLVMLAGFVHNYEIDTKDSLGYLYPVSNMSFAFIFQVV